MGKLSKLYTVVRVLIFIIYSSNTVAYEIGKEMSLRRARVLEEVKTSLWIGDVRTKHNSFNGSHLELKNVELINKISASKNTLPEELLIPLNSI